MYRLRAAMSGSVGFSGTVRAITTHSVTVKTHWTPYTERENGLLGNYFWVTDCISLKILPIHAPYTTNPLLMKKRLCVRVCFVSPHRLGRLLVCVLCGEVLQDLLVVTLVDVVAVNLQDDLAWQKTCCRRLPACRVSTRDKRSKVTGWYNYSRTVYNT